MSYAIESAERVRVPAGEFDGFVLARTQALTASSGRTSRRDVTRIWYAPAVRWWVKIEQTSSAMHDVTSTGVALEITRP